MPTTPIPPDRSRARCARTPLGRAVERGPVDRSERQGESRGAGPFGARAAKQPSRARRASWRGAGSLVLLALLSLSSACNSYSFYLDGPNFRGITVPLPPPSYKALQEPIRIDVEGSLPGGQSDPDAIAYLYDVTGERGYFTIVEPDGRTFIVRDVLTDLADNCFASYVEIDGQETDVAFFEIVVLEGDACDDSLCSAQDEEGACLCVDPWSLPCS